MLADAAINAVVDNYIAAWRVFVLCDAAPTRRRVVLAKYG